MLVGVYRVGYTSGVEEAFRALSNTRRRTILEALAVGPATVGELGDLLSITRPGVTRHLKILADAGLVEVQVEAQRRVYLLRPEPFTEVVDWLTQHRAIWQRGRDTPGHPGRGGRQGRLMKKTKPPTLSTPD